ncbi:Uncharacterized protein TCM_016405 [Theobroma cacao]|uniref:Uncharacterized protein n=1 Tax=Theobroma cacao TaxID=3641 RepID=A0A061G5U3_THECC|nr:Uncharacterized protein TCM_016405 [Theobroma cacao]
MNSPKRYPVENEQSTSVQRGVLQGAKEQANMVASRGQTWDQSFYHLLNLWLLLKPRHAPWRPRHIPSCGNSSVKPRQACRSMAIPISIS